MPGKKELKFRYIVAAALPIIINKYAKPNQSNLNMMFDVLGKTLSVTEEELNVGKTPMSERAKDFLLYQFYITNERPYWYQGAQIKREQ